MDAWIIQRHHPLAGKHLDKVPSLEPDHGGPTGIYQKANRKGEKEGGGSRKQSTAGQNGLPLKKHHITFVISLCCVPN